MKPIYESFLFYNSDCASRHPAARVVPDAAREKSLGLPSSCQVTFDYVLRASLLRFYLVCPFSIGVRVRAHVLGEPRFFSRSYLKSKWEGGIGPLLKVNILN